MKKILFILGLLGLFAIPANAITVVEKPMGYISVSTSATNSVTPSIASVSFTIETTDVNSQRAVERNAQISTKVLNELKASLKSDTTSQIKTRNYSLRPNYSTNKSETTQIINYTVTNTIDIKTAKIDKIGEIISSAVANNVTRVSEVVFSTESTSNGAENAINEAITNARNIAKLSASKMNQKIVGIKSMHINTYQQTNRGQVYTSLKQDSASGNIPLEKGNVILNVNVNAEFYVK